MKKRWYEMAGLKHVTGFLTEPEKDDLRRLAQAQDRSLVKYVTHILKEHLKKNLPPASEPTAAKETKITVGSSKSEQSKNN